VHAKSSAGLGASGGTINVNRADLIDTVADRVGISKQQAGDAVQTVTDEITRAVAKGQRVALTGFGVFEKADRKARTGRNPQTGATVKIKKTSVPKFRPGAQFKGVVSGAVKLGKVAESKARGTAARATGGASTRSTTKSSTSGRSTAKKSTATSSAAKKSTAKSSTAKKSSAARKSSGTKAASKSTARKSSGGKSAAKGSSTRKTSARKR
jgi:DNA-binding protein HU-beta